MHHLYLFALGCLRLVELHQILNIFLAAEEDRAPFVDLSGLNVKNPLCPRGGEASSLCEQVSVVLASSRVLGGSYLLGEVGHGEGLIEKPEFTVLALLVIGITENAAIQQCSVDISHHGPDIPSRVRRLARRRELN